MRRFFGDSFEPGRARLSADDAKHVFRVLRMRAGDALLVLDGRGGAYEATLERVSDAEAVCALGAYVPLASEPACRVTLFQCLPKADKFETIVQKCTELGAARIVPVLSTRCVSVPKDDGAKKRLVRWQRIALEAAKQSGRGVIPAIETTLSLDKIDPGAFGLCLLAYEGETAVTLKSVLQGRGGVETCALIIGPEGGFDPAEAAGLVSRGAVSVSLGPRILRTETAGMAMLSQLLYEVEP